MLWLLLFLPACTRAPAGGWPSLAPRPGEAAATPTATAIDTAGDIPGAEQPSGPAPVSATRGDVLARLTSATRDLQAAEARWRAQRSATERATMTAKSSRAGDPSWASAQLELSRLEQAGAAFDDIDATLNALAGDIASDAAGGAGISAANLSAVGRAIARARDDRRLNTEAVTAMKAGFSR